MTDLEKQEGKPDVETEPTKTNPEPAQEKTFTQSELNAILKVRLEDERKKFEDYETLREKASKYDKVEEENLSELEKLQKQLAEAQSKAEKAEASRQAAERNAKIVSEATKLNFADPADAVVLVGNAENVEEALKALAESKPYLLKTEQKQPKPKLNPSNPGPLDLQETREQKRARLMSGGSRGIDPFSPEGAAQLGGGVIAPLGNMDKIEEKSTLSGK